MDEYWNIYMQN